MEQLRDMLAGFKPGSPQIVMNMTVIPLLFDGVEATGIAGAESIALDKDTSYNSLHLITTDDLAPSQVAIVPGGFTYLTKESAQDRSVPNVQLISGSESKEVKAYCVQSSQSGHMRSNKGDAREMRLLPLPIRQKAMTAGRQDNNYSALWGSINALNRSMNISGDYLVSWFNKLQTELQQFVAQFEPIPQQRGALTLINGRLVGIDIAPTCKAWEELWESLIRDCYGSEALRTQGEAQVLAPTSLGQVFELDQLRSAVRAMQEKETEWAYGIVKEVLDQVLIQDKLGSPSQHGGNTLTVRQFKTPELTGEAVTDANDVAVYLSVFRHSYAPAKAKAFAI